MIVRIEVTQINDDPASYWQLKRCQVQRAGMMEEVSDPTYLLPIRFATLEEAVRHAKKATFAYLETKRHKQMPEQLDWRIVDDGHMFPCPVCHQPLYQKAKLGRLAIQWIFTIGGARDARRRSP